MKKRYLIIGGSVISKNDGDKHYINAARLALLYHVNPDECVFCENKYPHDMEINPKNRTDLIILRPRYDEDYSAIYGK